MIEDIAAEIDRITRLMPSPVIYDRAVIDRHVPLARENGELAFCWRIPNLDVFDALQFEIVPFSRSALDLFARRHDRDQVDDAERRRIVTRSFTLVFHPVVWALWTLVSWVAWHRRVDPHRALVWDLALAMHHGPVPRAAHWVKSGWDHALQHGYAGAVSRDALDRAIDALGPDECSALYLAYRVDMR